MSTLRTDTLQTTDSSYTIDVDDIAKKSELLALGADLANEVDPVKGASLVGFKGRTLAEKLSSELVSPMDFGAVGDGVADDTAAVQAAINASLNVSGGDHSKIYKISSTLLLRDNQHLNLSGAKFQHVTPQTPMFNATNKVGAIVENGVLQGIKESPYINSPSSQAICITCSGSIGLIVRNNKFIDWCYAPVMAATGCDGLTYIDNEVIGPGTTVLSADVNYRNTTGGTLIGTNIVASGNRLSATASGLIVGQGSQNVIVTGNIIHNTINEHGMYVDTGVKNVTITGNNVRSTGVNGVGIKVQHYDSYGVVPEGVVISGNTIGNTGSDGILVINTVGNTGVIYGDSYSITGNALVNIGAVGIDVRNVRNCSVSGNSVDIAGTHGIFISKTTVLSVTGNSVRNTQLSGYFDDGTSSDVVVSSNIFSATALNGSDVSGTSSGMFIQSGSEYVIQNNVVRGSGATMQYGLWISSGDQSTIDVKGNSLTGAREVGARFAGTPLRYFGENLLRGTLGDNVGTNIPAVNQRGSEEWNFFSTAVPSAGTWPQGAKVYNRFPLAGGFIGWVCVVAGTPGSWKTFGVVSP